MRTESQQSSRAPVHLEVHVFVGLCVSLVPSVSAPVSVHGSAFVIGSLGLRLSVRLRAARAYVCARFVLVRMFVCAVLSNWVRFFQNSDALRCAFRGDAPRDERYSHFCCIGCSFVLELF